MSSVIILISYIISLFLIVVNVNKFTHIFQQSFYERDEFFPAIKTTKSARIQLYEIILLIFSVLSFLNIYWLFIYAAFSIFTAYKTINHRPVAKKKFVYTNRIKITYAIIFILLILSVVGVHYIS